MNNEILPVNKNESAGDPCQPCSSTSELCLKATMKAVMNADASVHNAGVRTLARSGGGLLGDISCAEQGCDYQERVDPHYLVIDAL